MVWMGAESGSQKILDAMDKGLRVDDIRTASRLLQTAGIDVGFFLQFGYPGETRDDIEATLQLARELEPADVGVSVSYPLPGTRFYQRVQQELGGKQNWVDSSHLVDDVRGHLCPRRLSPRPRPGASRVPGAEIRARAERAADGAVDARPRHTAPCGVMGA